GKSSRARRFRSRSDIGRRSGRRPNLARRVLLLLLVGFFQLLPPPQPKAAADAGVAILSCSPRRCYRALGGGDRPGVPRARLTPGWPPAPFPAGGFGSKTRKTRTSCNMTRKKSCRCRRRCSRRGRLLPRRSSSTRMASTG
ncbi:unnamed protein product, partial [Ectocarpus sp. 12 AP-2014]